MQKLHEIAMAAGGTFTPYGAGGILRVKADYACKLEIEREIRLAGFEFSVKPLGEGEWSWICF